MNRRKFVGRLARGVAGLAVAETISGCANERFAPLNFSSTPKVRNGIDVLVENNFAPLLDLRLGLITNHTGHDIQRRPTIDLLKNRSEEHTSELQSRLHLV